MRDRAVEHLVDARRGGQSLPRFRRDLEPVVAGEEERRLVEERDEISRSLVPERDRSPERVEIELCAEAATRVVDEARGKVVDAGSSDPLTVHPVELLRVE